MLHPLQKQVRAVGARAHRLLFQQGVARFAAMVVSAVLLAGLIDYTCRISDTGVRVILSLSVVAVAVWAAYWFVQPAWRFRISDVALARRIEQHLPDCGDRLSSTMEFLQQTEDDPTAGSPELRRAVVAEATARLAEYDFGACLDRSRATKATVMAVGVCLVAALIGGWNTTASGLALKRMVIPWGSEDWPRRHELKFQDTPHRLAAGQDFVATLVDANGALPDDVVVEYRVEGRSQIDVEPPVVLSKNVAELRLTNVTKNFQFRARGGDDQAMNWQDLEIVEPPRTVSVSTRIDPPVYSGLPVEELAATTRVLIGSKIGIRGQVTKPVRQVLLRRESDERPLDVEVQVGADGLSFWLPGGDEATNTPWEIAESDTFWLDLVDTEGLVGRSEQQWEVRAIKDLAPSVALEKPAGPKFLTAEANVPIAALVKDDLGIASAELVYVRSDQTDVGEQVVELYRAEHPPDFAGQDLAVLTGESRDIQYQWELNALPGTLTAGTQFDFYVRARDYKPNAGESGSRRITIISIDELEDRVAARQSTILGQLAEVLRLQHAARTQTESLQVQLVETKVIASTDVDQLQSAELNQRSVTRLLTSGSDSVVARIREVLEDLNANRVDRPEVYRKLREILDVVNGMARQEIPAVQRELIGSLKVARASGTPEDPQVLKEINDSLSAATVGQGQVIQKLEALLGDLTQWDNYRRFAREVGRIRREQEELQSQTQSQRAKMFGTTTDEEESQQRAEMRQLALRQMELARRFDRVQSRMDKMQAELADTDPLAAATIADALDAARRNAVSSQMRESGRSVEKGQAGQASNLQKQAMAGLKEVQDVLSNRRESELGRLTEKLREAEADVADLKTQQSALTRKLKSLESDQQKKPADKQRELMRLAREQEQLAKQAEAMRRRLQRLRAEKPGSTMEEAAATMQQGAQAGQQGEQQSALENAQQSEKLLEQAEQQLQQEAQKKEQDLLNEQLVRLEQTITGFIKRQTTVNQRTLEFETLRESQDGSLKRSQLASVGDLAAEQRLMADDARALSEKLEQAETFVFALRGAMQEMARSASGLERRETGQDTQQAQANALVRLNQLKEALKPDLKEGPQQPPQQQQGGEGGQNQQPPADGIQRLAELKLVKLLQEEVNRRTLELEQQRQMSGMLTDAQADELVDLSEQQGKLAEMILNLVQQVMENPEDNPEDLPDVRDDEGLDDEGLDDELLRELDAGTSSKQDK